MKTFTLFYVVVSNGDGSASPKFFRSKESQQKRLEAEEASGEGLCDAAGELEFFIDDNGEIQSADILTDFGKKHPEYTQIRD